MSGYVYAKYNRIICVNVNFEYLYAKYQDMEKFIGRERELRQIKAQMDSDRSEFIAVYGRRRVGKTLLIRKAAEDRFSFFVTGIYQRPRNEQLINFAISLQRASGSSELSIRNNWILAFYDLSRYLETLPEGKKIIFIDELPWMDTPKSGFVSAVDNFWNEWAVLRDDIKLVVCGSATSWMLDNIIHETGGLHKRLTGPALQINPLNLAQMEHFLFEKGFSYSRKQIAECYMIMGGVPYYLSMMDKSKSLAQNIDYLFFGNEAPLKNEFNEIFQALYRKSANHKKIMVALAARGIGATRQELLLSTGLENNGAFSKMLEEIEECGFIRSYDPFNSVRVKEEDKARPDTLYQMVDSFSLFYYRFISENRYQDEYFWTMNYSSPLHAAWSGLAFEMLCLNHLKEIKKALGISGVQTVACSWRSARKAQIDLLIDRKDDTISLCEMKYSKDEYAFSSEEEMKLERRINTFLSESRTRKSIITTLITTFGLKNNAHSSSIQAVVTLDDLFQ